MFHGSHRKISPLLAGIMTVALLSGVSAGSRAQDAAKTHGPIAWKESLDEAKKIAAKEKKIIFLDFWAEWCGPCKQMLKTTYQDKAVVERSKQFVPVLINYDKQTALVKKYHVGQIPVVIFMDASGKVLKQTEPKLIDAKEFLKLMDEASKKRKG
jgi:thiol:disulfide interchange protein